MLVLVTIDLDAAEKAIELISAERMAELDLIVSTIAQIFSEHALTPLEGEVVASGVVGMTVIVGQIAGMLEGLEEALGGEEEE